MKPLSLGFSPCPNDTFIFCELVHNFSGRQDISFKAPLLEDVERLNMRAFQRQLDVTKLSYHAAGHLLDEYCVLQSGSALGRGCGPLLVAAGPMPAEQLGGCRVAVPGRYTTAALLFTMFLPQCTDLVEMGFEKIMQAVVCGEVDAGVIIHESRFTYRQAGLVCLQDLGQWWEQTSGLPIPLGCIAARRSLGVELIARIDERINHSLRFALENQHKCLHYVREHAQETEEQVMRSHIDLYVNDFSLDLGPVGRAAVETFLAKGRAAGILPSVLRSAFCRE